MTEIKTATRVGKIRYTNCLPYYYGLRSDDFPIEYYEAVPAEINTAMHEGRVDIAPISSLEYLNHQGEYMLLPDLAIGSRDFSGSVLLLSRQKIENINDVTIALTRESLSSVTLLKVLLKLKYKFENHFIISASDPEEMIKKNKAALVIGDDALFFTPREFIYKYDLSELWWNWTEKPFCFALWAVRRSFAQNHPEEVAAFWARLRKNLEKNLSDIQTLIQESLGLSFLDDRFPKIFGYLFNLNYGLDPAMLEGLELFFRFAKRLEISPAHQPFEFFKISS